MKKFLCFALSAILIFALNVVSFGADAAAGGSMVISTSVPEKSKITVHYNSDGGYVMFDGKICPDGTEITVGRFGDVNLDVVCGKNHHVSKVTVNGEDVTDKFENGTLRLEDVASDITVEFGFRDCTTDPNDKCEKLNVGGTVYLGDKKVENADLNFDFGNYTAKTDENGRYFVEDLSEGRHSVTVTKDGQKLGTCEFVVEFSDSAADTTVQKLPDGTQLVTVPSGTKNVYLDFVIVDDNGDGIPDIDPDLTDPTIPPEGGFAADDTTGGSGGSGGSGNPDENDSGMYITVGTEPDNKQPDNDKPNDVPDNNDKQPDNKPSADTNDKKPAANTDTGDKKPSKVDKNKIPTMGALLSENLWIPAAVMLASLFFIVILLLKRKKDKEEEEAQYADFS